MVEAAEDLAGRLRYAQALVIISPGASFTATEVQTIQAFVDKGGRLLLVGDPTRFGVLMDEYGDYAGLDSDATHLNSLAAQFDLVFQPDYLYNTAEYEGNYRNIRLTEMASQPLTGGLEQVVFYAAHSLISGQPALIVCRRRHPLQQQRARRRSAGGRPGRRRGGAGPRRPDLHDRAVQCRL